ncbi:hypothetical protein CH313_08635 [Streptomyces sp. TSRI0384-2]|nr:hypothetical protein CH313_08635 [Streptomyces sp. TSRI0384-2]
MDLHRYAAWPGGAELRDGDTGTDRGRAQRAPPGPGELLGGQHGPAWRTSPGRCPAARAQRSVISPEPTPPA